MAETVTGVIKGKLQDEMDRLTEAVSTGRLGSYEDYKGVCGNIRGIEYAINLITDMERHLKEQDDYD